MRPFRSLSNDTVWWVATQQIKNVLLFCYFFDKICRIIWKHVMCPEAARRARKNRNCTGNRIFDNIKNIWFLKNSSQIYTTCVYTLTLRSRDGQSVGDAERKPNRGCPKIIWRHPVLGPGGGGGGGCPEPKLGFGAKLTLLPGIWRKVVVWRIPFLAFKS